MPKRKRLSSSHDDDEESVTSESSSAAPSAAGIGTRKRRRCGTVSQEQLKQLLEAVLNHKRADGSFVSETFFRLPKRRLNPDYFETVQNPIDFAKIQVNLNTHQYDDLSQLASDIELLVENAKQYYPRSSREYTDAVALWNAFNEHRAAIVPEEALSEKKDDEKPEKITLRIGRMHRRGSEPTPLTGDEESEAGSSAAPRSESSNWTPGGHPRDFGHRSTSRSRRKTSASSVLLSAALKAGPPPSPPPALSPPPTLSLPTLSPPPPTFVMGAADGPPKLEREVETGTEDVAAEMSELTSGDNGYSGDPKNPVGQKGDAEIPDEADVSDRRAGSLCMDKYEDEDHILGLSSDFDIESAGLTLNSTIDIKMESIAQTSPIEDNKIQQASDVSSKSVVTDPAESLSLKVDTERDLDIANNNIKAERTRNKNTESAPGGTPMEDEPSRASPDSMPPPLLPCSSEPGRPGADFKRLTGRILYVVPGWMCRGECRPPGSRTSGRGHSRGRGGSRGSSSRGRGQPPGSSRGRGQPPFSTSSGRGRPRKYPLVPCTCGGCGANPEVRMLHEVRRRGRRPSTVARAARQAALETAVLRPKELEDALEELFTAIGTATDPEGRLLSTWFQLVPHRTKLPQYYDVIKQPMDLKTVAQRIQASEYSSLSELEADLQLVFRNACTFNEPGSQIYKDAKVLRKLAQTRRAEIEHARLTAAKSSERIRSKRIGGTACLSAELSQLTYDEDEERSSSDSNMSEDNPLWQLFDAVRSHTTPSGFLLSEPFQTLPSRRLYPDYYEEIKNPIALRQIKRKMKDSLYSGIQEMEDDMNLMFENARQYNPPDSKLYKDSIRLQKVLQKKVAEMSADFDEGEEENSEEDSMPLPPVSTRKASQRRDHPVKERCKQLYRTIRDYVNEEGRQLSTVFTELPSRKLYPDYYEIIDSPIDLARIESKIRGDQYESESEILQDFKLMFNNCRQYNEEGSVIYDDANVLERVLMSRVRELGPLPTQDGARHKPRVLSRAQLVEKMWTLFNTIRDHKDATGRQLSLIFVKLPSKLEYPDYFEVIKNPIHLERISQKLKTGTYNTLDEMMADLVLMFDNACKYNEPDSQVYKDALNLHRLALQTKLQLTEDVEEVPDVKTQIQELLTSLFIATYNHQDADGRCFSDSLAELPEHDEVEGQSRVRGISMEIIKRRLDRGLYTRLDVFQEDVFAVLDRARRLSKHDSQTFEDACEMQMFFISYRDELCRSGTLLSSPALSFSQDNLKELIAQLKPEVKNEEDESQDAKPAPQGDAMSFNQIQYCTGEFVYVEPKDKGVEKHIVNIERLWTNNEGQQMMYGCWFFRPEETFHLHTRKFLEKEVFKSDQHIGCPLSQIVGKCAVMSVKDYFRLQPEGYAEQDVYVCESRYSSKSKTFKKIKMYPFSAPPETLREREVPLEPRRVMSVFKKRVEKHKEELAELEECEMKIRTREVPNVEIDNRSAMDGNTYYEQLNTGMLVLKTGDCVYVKSEHSKQVIAQVDTMWTTPDGSQYFHGPTYMTSAEIASSVQQMFYKQEVFVSLLEDTHPMAFVTGKCCVLDYTDYCSRRPTEIPEADVYVCENLFDESKRQIVPRGGDPKRYVHSEAVLEDEVYHFRRLLVLRKQPLATIQQEASERIKSLFAEAVGVSSPAGSKVGDEDSLDGPPASVGSADNASVGTPVSSYKKSKRLKILTGYILYSADIRKKITSNNPSANFGDISRLVGTEWKNLSAAEKASYEERAARMNADSVASLRVEMADTPSRAVLGASLVGPDVVYDCCWLGCDFQYEDMSELIDHCNAEPGGHVPVYAATVSDEYQCQWRGCNRIKKGSTPFPNAGRLMRHVKEVHIQKNNGRVVAPHERGRNFVPRRGSAAAGAAAGQGGAVRQHGPGSGVSTPTSSTGAPEPRFVAAPARPQRLLHSEAYIRYIETLQPERASVPQQQGGWERQLHATPETTPIPDTARLPTHWLADGLADSTSVVKTLWHLRDYLMKDALGISRAYEGRL